MKPRHNLVILLLSAAIFSGCANPGEKQLTKLLRKEGIVAFQPPIGNAANAKDWNKFGPGAVVDAKRGRSRGHFEISANSFSKKQRDDQTVMDEAQRTAILLPQVLVFHRQWDGSFGSTPLAAKAGAIVGAAGAENITTVTINLEGVWKAMPYAGHVLKDWKAEWEAQHGRLPDDTAIVWAPVVANRVFYTFTDSGGKNISVPVASGIGKGSITDIQVKAGGVESTHPMFIGFYPLK